MKRGKERADAVAVIKTQILVSELVALEPATKLRQNERYQIHRRHSKRINIKYFYSLGHSGLGDDSTLHDLGAFGVFG